MTKWICLVALAAAACGSPAASNGAEPQPDAGADVTSPADGGAGAPGSDAASDAVADAPGDVQAEATQDAGTSCDDKAKACASSFGSLFTKSDGRADGTLVALVRPVDQQCALPNSTHVVLQLSIQGVVQRLVASVSGVGVDTVQAPLVGPAYAEGWHTNTTLDYPSQLGVHSTDFTSVSLDQAVAFICDHVTVGAPVSVYAYSDGSQPDSAHQIHYNAGYSDGAIVVGPTSANPTWLLFRYDTDTF